MGVVRFACINGYILVSLAFFTSNTLIMGKDKHNDVIKNVVVRQKLESTVDNSVYRNRGKCGNYHERLKRTVTRAVDY